MKNKVSDIVANFLKEKKIKVAFGIIGSANSHIFNSINELGYTRIINVHHEQVAVMAAGAYFRTSGLMSAAIVTAGAGASNAITGVISNWADSIPSLIISGQEPYRYVLKDKHQRMYGTQGFNVVKMVKSVTKYSKMLTDPSHTLYELSKCYEKSISGRFGPCWIDIPFDLQSEICDQKNLKKYKLKNHISCNEKYSLKNLIGDSKRPVILAGHGIKLSNSIDLFRNLINKTEIPTLLSWSAIDIIDNENKSYYGRFGVYGQRSANFLIQNSDCIIILGSRLALPQIGYEFGQFAPNAKKIIVDIDKNEGLKYNYDQFIHSDCNDFLKKLKIDIKKSSFKNWLKYCEKSKKSFPIISEIDHRTKDYINSYKFVDELCDLLDDEDIIVTDMGTALLSGHQAFKIKGKQKMFTSLGLGEMGYGIAGAIGASYANLNKRIICLNCDGGIMMNLQELHTIIENKLNIKIIIFNNDGYLMIKHTQKMLFKGNYTSVNKKTGIGLPNFENLSNGFGYNYYNYKKNDDRNSILDFLNDKNPSVLEVFMDPEQGFNPKVKGVLNEDGSIMSPPLEEMSPLLPLNVIKENMLNGLNSKSLKIKR